jgi:septal ring factor EnvC (AmiA/AmiB activator)
MQNGIKHVKIELQNIKSLTAKDFTNTAGQAVDVPALWIEFMTKHLSLAEQKSKAWLNKQVLLAEKLYTAHMADLKKLQTQLEQDDRKTGAAKTQHDSNLKAKLQKLDTELKQKDTALTNAKKEEDAARKIVKDIEDKIDKEPKQAQKKAIKTKEDLPGKKDALQNKEEASLAALKAKNLKERAIHVLQLQTVNGLIVSVKADQDQLKAYKAAVVAIKMPKAV